MRPIKSTIHKVNIEHLFDYGFYAFIIRDQANKGYLAKIKIEEKMFMNYPFGNEIQDGYLLPFKMFQYAESMLHENDLERTVGFFFKIPGSQYKMCLGVHIIISRVPNKQSV